MDAIMLQEKLVERLLCPRVRTARQKVKRWQQILGLFISTGKELRVSLNVASDLFLRGIFLQLYQQFVCLQPVFFTELLLW